MRPRASRTIYCVRNNCEPKTSSSTKRADCTRVCTVIVTYLCQLSSRLCLYGNWIRRHFVVIALCRKKTTTTMKSIDWRRTWCDGNISHLWQCNVMSQYTIHAKLTDARRTNIESKNVAHTSVWQSAPLPGVIFACHSHIIIIYHSFVSVNYSSRTNSQTFNFLCLHKTLNCQLCTRNPWTFNGRHKMP